VRQLTSIGEASRQLGLNPSALRYYEERGLIASVTRIAGRRMYDEEQLRRLVLIQIMHSLGIPLAAAASVLDDPDQQWRTTLGGQIDALDDLIARASLAKDFLSRARDCGTAHPVAECPKLQDLIGRRLDGASLDELAQAHREAHRHS
jgi:DNA-binding transcriptional MerR regulator